MRLNRKPLAVLLVLLLVPLVLAGVLFFLLWLDSDHAQLKKQLQFWFNQNTGQYLAVDGPIQVRFWPTFELTSSQVRVMDAANNRLLEIGKLSVVADPLAFFQDKLSIQKVMLQHASLKLVKDRQGNFNITSPDGSGVEENKVPQNVILPVENLELIDSQLFYVDQQKNITVGFSDIDISLKALHNENIQFMAGADFSLPDDLNGRIKISADITFKEFIDVNSLDVQLYVNKNSNSINAALSGNLRFSPVAEFIQASSLLLVSEQLGLKASLNANAIQEGYTLSVKLAGMKPDKLKVYVEDKNQLALLLNLVSYIEGDFDITSGKQALTVTMSPMKINEAQMQGQLILSDDLTSLILKVDEIEAGAYLKALEALSTYQDPQDESQTQLFTSSLQINSLKFEQGRIEQLVNKLELKNGQLIFTEGSMVAHQLNPALLLQQHAKLLPKEFLSDFKLTDQAFNYLDGAISYRVSADNLELKDMDLTVDDTTINGGLSYNFLKPEIMANLSIGHIDADRYLNVFQNRQAVSTDKTDDVAAELINWLKKAGGQGEVNIDLLTYQGATYKDLRLRFNDQ